MMNKKTADDKHRPFAFLLTKPLVSNPLFTHPSDGNDQLFHP